MNKHLFRFLGTPTQNDAWVLDAEDTHHARKVLRLKKGDQIEVSDGQGRVVLAEIIHFHNDQSTLRTIKQMPDEKPSLPCITLYIGVLENDSCYELIEELSELGVNKLVFYKQANTPKKRYSEKAQLKWQRLARTSLKQCKRSHLLDIQFADSLEVALQAHADKNIICLLPGEPPLRQLLADLQPTPPQWSWVIGSEAGFEQEEIVWLKNQSNISFASLNTPILRAKHAALAVAILTKQFL